MWSGLIVQKHINYIKQTCVSSVWTELAWSEGVDVASASDVGVRD